MYTLVYIYTKVYIYSVCEREKGWEREKESGESPCEQPSNYRERSLSMGVTVPISLWHMFSMAH